MPSRAQAHAATAPIATLEAPAAHVCQHQFLDPLSWMRPELEQGKLEGRLECPNLKCGANVGRYAWQGMKCSCGLWICPAISLQKAKVDEVRRVAAVRAIPGGGTGREKI